MSDFIDYQLVHLRIAIKKRLKSDISDLFIPLIYIGGGGSLFIIIPTFTFTLVEDWTIFDSLYFGFISLSYEVARLSLEPLRGLYIIYSI